MVYSDSIWTKSNLVVTKRRQKFSKNSDLFTALGKGAIRMSEGLTKYFGV